MQQHVVVFTGASSAIAQATVRQYRQTLAASGQAAVCIGLGRALSARGLDSVYDQVIEVDVLSGVAVQEAFGVVSAQHGAIHGLVHAVGSILVAPLHRTSEQQWQDVINVNLTSAMFALRAFLAEAKKPGQTVAEQGVTRSVVLISSCAAHIGVANHEAIAAAKAGLAAMAQSAAATYAADGIRVNVVAPGLTDSPIAGAFLKSEVMAAAAARQYPLGGVNTPDQVAAAVTWLLSEASARTTGVILPVDGGFSVIRPLVK